MDSDILVHLLVTDPQLGQHISDHQQSHNDAILLLEFGLCFIKIDVWRAFDKYDQKL
jgi:hypothetical protein